MSVYNVHLIVRRRPASVSRGRPRLRLPPVHVFKKVPGLVVALVVVLWWRWWCTCTGGCTPFPAADRQPARRSVGTAQHSTSEILWTDANNPCFLN